MLQKHAHWNDLSDKLRTELEEKVRSLGPTVRFKFDISRPNPDPEKYNGATLWPSMYALDPKTFRITDAHEDRKNTSKSKEIGLINKIDREGKPESFHSVRIFERHKGVLIFKPQDSVEDFNYVMYLLIHPKLVGGKFQDSGKQGVIQLVDDKKEAAAKREQRSEKSKALAVATNMKDSEVLQFVDAMVWDRTQEPEILREMVEAEAENNPKLFNDLVSSKNLEYQALIKQALDKQVIAYDPATFRFVWFQNQQTIATLSPVGDQNQVQKMSEWLQTAGKNADEVFNKIKSLVK